MLRLAAIAACLFVCSTAWADERQGAKGPCSHESFERDGATRGFILCVPDPLPDGPMPVILAFHGGGGNATGWMQRMPFHEHGSKHGFLTVYMQGCRAGLADCSDPTGRYLWNIDKPGQSSPVDDKGYVREVLRRLAEVHGLAVDSTRIYATGHSLGGIFIYSLACDEPGLLAAIGPISAPPTDSSCTPRGHTSVFHIHGTADANVPFDTGCCSAAQKRRGGAEYLAGCGALPLCHNPVNWWPPVRSGMHPVATVSGLDEFARAGLGCSMEWRITVESGITTCSSFVGCTEGEAEVCLVQGVDHSLPDIDRAVDVRDHLWSRFNGHVKAPPFSVKKE